MPCPSSHFPVYAVTRPSAPIAIHESSCSGSTCDRRVSNGPCPDANAAVAMAPKLTMSAPDFRKSRRVISGATLHLLCIPPDRPQHACMGEAAAQHGRQRLLDLL